MRRIIGQITIIKKEGDKKTPFANYLSTVHAYKLGMLVFLLFSLAFLSDRVPLKSPSIIEFWLFSTIIYLFVYPLGFPIIGNLLNRTRWAPYELVFKEYPIDYGMNFLIFLLAFANDIAPHVRDLLPFLGNIVTVVALIVIIAGVLPQMISLFQQRDLEYAPVDLVGGLLNFFKETENYIIITPLLIVTLVGGNQLRGTINGFEKDLLILSWGDSKEYITWESIASFHMSQRRPLLG